MGGGPLQTPTLTKDRPRIPLVLDGEDWFHFNRPDLLQQTEVLHRNGASTAAQEQNTWHTPNAKEGRRRYRQCEHV